MWGPEYPGQLTADWQNNPFITTALSGAMEQAGKYDDVLQQLIGQFSNPVGARGWMPTLPNRGSSQARGPVNPLGPYTGWGGTGPRGGMYTPSA
jgi:hypothetical protein